MVQGNLIRHHLRQTSDYLQNPRYSRNPELCKVYKNTMSFIFICSHSEVLWIASLYFVSVYVCVYLSIYFQALQLQIWKDSSKGYSSLPEPPSIIFNGYGRGSLFFKINLWKCVWWVFYGNESMNQTCRMT